MKEIKSHKNSYDIFFFIHRYPRTLPSSSQSPTIFHRHSRPRCLKRPNNRICLLISTANPNEFCYCVPYDMATTDKNIHVFDSEEALSVSLAKYTADLSEKFAKQKGSFTIALSGGSLIKSLRKLVEAPYIDSVDWSKWHVFWVDERVVPKQHPNRNYLLAFDSLLSKVLRFF